MTATHLFGLKFIPTCEPVGADILCGQDYLYIGGIVAIILIIIWIYDIRRRYKCQEDIKQTEHQATQTEEEKR